MVHLRDEIAQIVIVVVLEWLVHRGLLSLQLHFIISRIVRLRRLDIILVTIGRHIAALYSRLENLRPNALRPIFGSERIG